MMSERIEIRFEQVFKEHYKPIYAFFFAQGVRSQDCHDLAQETFLRVFRNLDDFRGETSIRSWIRHIAINVWRNELRRRAAKKRGCREVSFEDVLRRVTDDEAFDPQDFAPASLPMNTILVMEKAGILSRSLDRLPCEMRRVAILRFVQDYKYREIASLLQISIETVKSQIFQARQKLREELGRRLESNRSEVQR